MSRKSPNHANAPDANFDPSAFTAIRAEDLDAIAHIKKSLVAHYQPANSEELYAIERIAFARHSLLRTYRMESGLVSFSLQKALQIGGVPEILKNPEDSYEPHVTKAQEESFWMATGFYEVNRLSPSCWQFFLRYQAQTERFYRRAMEEFERLRRHRGRIPEQIDAEPAPQPTAGQPPTPEPKTSPTPHVDRPAIPAPTQPAAASPRGRPTGVSRHPKTATVLPRQAPCAATPVPIEGVGEPRGPRGKALPKILPPSCRRNSASRSIALSAHLPRPGG